MRLAKKCKLLNQLTWVQDSDIETDGLDDSLADRLQLVSRTYSSDTDCEKQKQRTTTLPYNCHAG